MATRRLGGIATSSSVPDNGGDNSGGGGSGGGYVEDVFSTYVYTGDQSNSSRDIVNGVDLDSHGGMVWIKIRSRDKPHYLFDNERGLGKYLNCNEAGAESAYSNGNLTAFNSDGFTIGDSHTINETGEDVASWTFRKAPSFFDVVTYSGDGVQGREIPHSLGVEPGMIIVKGLSGDHWYVYHRSTGATNYLALNLTNAASPWSVPWNDTEPTGSVFTVGGTSSSAVNGDGLEYVAYLFAHDDSDESMIKCGSYTGNETADGNEVDLGFEPQFVLIKACIRCRRRLDTCSIPCGALSPLTALIRS